LDRAPFDDRHCGETRLVYRLAYRTELEGMPVDSRLPMTVNVVLWQDDPAGCEAVARRWLAPRDLGAAALGQWLVREPDGPLAPSQIDGARLKSVETNVQIVRWPAVMHPSLGGHAEYALRAFHPRGDDLQV